MTKTISREVIGTSDKGEDTIKVTVDYRKDARVRGYYLAVTRSTVKQENGYRSESFAVFGGIPSRLLLAVPRFSAKQLDALAPDPAVVDEMRAAVLAKA